MQNHYNYSFDTLTNTYNFITKNGILYRVAFVVDETFSTISGKAISNVYQIVIDKATDETEPFDKYVSKTVENIIECFFMKIENALIYVCSDDDEKASLRYKVFDRWYQNSQHKENIVKIDNVLSIKIDHSETQLLYTSFMFHKNNEHFETLMSIYLTMESALNNK